MKNKNYLLISIFCVISFLLFFLYLSIKTNTYDTKYKDKEFISGEFIVISIKESKEYYNEYVVKNRSNDIFILKIKKSEDILLQVKNKIYLEGIFKLPDLNRNEGGFNYRRYLNSKKIYGTISVDALNLLEEGKLDFITKIKNSIEETFLVLLPKDYAGIINGILNGDTKNISKETLKEFKDSGITHLLAVSGSNVAYIVLAVGLCSNKIFGKYLAYYIKIMSIIIFIFVSGASASVARAGIMAILSIVAILFSNKSNTLINIFISLIILLIINPLVIYDVGFILSFLGTLGIVLLSQKIVSKINKLIKIKFIADTLGVTLAAQIMLLPIMAYYFNNISIISLITNLLVVPVSGFLTILGFITVLVSKISLHIASLISYGIYSLISFMACIASLFSKFPFANLIVPTPKLMTILIYYITVFLIFFDIDKKVVIKIFTYKRIRKIKVVLFEMLALFIIIYNLVTIIPRNYIKLNMIDVGQGDSFYVETQNKKVILIDGGGSKSSDYDVGENIVVPYLLDQGRTKIDLIIISHPHEDHIEGTLTVIEKLKVKKVLISGNINDNHLIIKLREVCAKNKTNVIEVSAGDSFKIDNVYFDVVYPSIKTKEQNTNNMSLVLKMRFGEVSTLFTGDLETEGEEDVFDNIKADILKIAHHGSKTSSSEAFLEKVMPKVAIISVGKDNSYGHPNNEVIERLKRINAKIYRTDELGEVKFIIKKNKIINDKKSGLTATQEFTM